MTTTNIYDLKYSSRIIVIKNKEIFFNGSYNKFLDKVDINKIGFKNSWENEISDKLIMYDLINDIHDNIDDIVGELCE